MFGDSNLNKLIILGNDRPGSTINTLYIDIFVYNIQGTTIIIYREEKILLLNEKIIYESTFIQLNSMTIIMVTDNNLIKYIDYSSEIYYSSFIGTLVDPKNGIYKSDAVLRLFIYGQG